MGCYKIKHCPICGRHLNGGTDARVKLAIRCRNCKFGRPIDKSKRPEKYYRDDCIVCECEDVVGDESMIYPPEHYCSFGRSS